MWRIDDKRIFFDSWGSLSLISTYLNSVVSNAFHLIFIRYHNLTWHYRAERVGWSRLRSSTCAPCRHSPCSIRHVKYLYSIAHTHTCCLFLSLFIYLFIYLFHFLICIIRKVEVEISHVAWSSVDYSSTHILYLSHTHTHIHIHIHTHTHTHTPSRNLLSFLIFIPFIKYSTL